MGGKFSSQTLGRGIGVVARNPKYMIVVGKREEEVGEGKGEYEGSREKRKSM